MRHYVNRNVINPDSLNRKITNMALAPNLNRGAHLAWNSRYKDLSEELREQGLLSGLGWNVKLNIKNRSWDFEVLEGRDLSVSQKDNPPVIFSPEFNSLKTLSYSDSLLDYKNVAIVAGPGEGADRIVVEVGEGEGVNRREVFIDARDIQDEVEGSTDEKRPLEEIVADLEERGRNKLSEMTQEQYLEGQILSESPFIYEKDYDLGDIVTVRHVDWGVTLDTRITEIRETYEPGGIGLEATFGNNFPNIIDKVGRQLEQISSEIRR